MVVFALTEGNSQRKADNEHMENEPRRSGQCNKAAMSKMTRCNKAAVIIQQLVCKCVKDTDDLLALRPCGDGVYHRKAKLALRQVLTVALAVAVLMVRTTSN